MNYSLRKFKTRTGHLFRFRPGFDPEMMLALLEKETDRDVIEEIMGLDIYDDAQIRLLLRKKQMLRFTRLKAHLDHRMALIILLKEKVQDDTLINLIVKSMTYPLVLFMVSFGMLVFTDVVMLRSFRSMLDFIGPDPDLGRIQTVIRLGIVMDLSLMVSLVVLALLIKLNPLRVYDSLNRSFNKNFWQRLLAHRFLSRFTLLYDLGVSIDQIMVMIEKSGDPVLTVKTGILRDCLSSGQTLSQAIDVIDPGLKRTFLMGEEGIMNETTFTNALKQREIKLKLTIRSAGKLILAYAYLKITLVIIMIYALMLKPVEMMENLL